ncbi:MAG: methylenetetrahydrofolate reductase, partial [Anaerohalosphaera sp.]|nr:methylenetetrahydrofolate reductase [Anaerohalosphaera sp.]
MARKKLSTILRQKTGFVVTVELTGAPGFGFGPIEHFLKGYKELASSVPVGFDVVGLAIPQNPGGVANIEPLSILTYAMENDLLSDLDFIPHITCKDHNLDSIISMLMTYKRMGVDSVLAFTGDKPVTAKGVFEVESVGLIDKISSMNAGSFLKAKPEQLDSIHQFYTGAAVSP